MKVVLITILTFASILNIDTQTQSTLSLVTKYIQELNVKMCYLFTCWNKFENMELIRMLDARNVKYSFIESTENMVQAMVEKNLVYYAHILDLTCKNFNISFPAKVNNKIMRLERPWLLLTNYSFSELDNIFQNIQLRMDSIVAVIIPEKNKTFKILKVYNPGFELGKKALITEVGYWNGLDLIIIDRNLTYYTQRKNMSNMQLRCASVVVNSEYLQRASFEEYMEDVRLKYLDTVSKFHYPVFLILEHVHKFTHTVLIEDRWFGDYENGTDAGVGQLLYENKIDVSCTGAGSLYSARIDAYDFLMPSYHVRNPGSNDQLTNKKFLEPFSTTVWYCMILSVVLICVLLQVFHRTENRFVGSKSKYSWAAAILTTSAVIFQQDSAAFPKGYGGRITFLVLQFLSLLLYNYYTSSIISSLLRKPPKTLHTLDELGHSNLEIGIENMPYTITWFKIKKDSDVQYIYKHKVFPPGAKHLNIFTPEEGIAKVSGEGFAYYTLLDTAYHFIAKTFNQDAICDLAEIRMIPHLLAGTIAPKKSQYRELFLITLRKAKEMGLMHRISQIWEAKKPGCLSSARVMAVGIDTVFTAFLILFIGMIMSLLFLFIEIIWYKLDLDRKFA